MGLLVTFYHLLPAAAIVLSFFFSVRCLFAHDLRIEAWRSPVKHWIYVDHSTFKRFLKLLGLMFFVAFLLITWHEITKLLHF